MATELRVALATCAELPEGDPDDAALVAALGAGGFDVSWRVWDDPGVDWGAFDAVVVRSTWDYQERRDEFLGWASRVPSLCNPAEIVGWNTDKRYLAELGSSGIPVVETTFVDPGEEAPELPEDGELVVKPSVSAGSRDTARFAMREPAERLAALALLRSIHASGRTAMLQPYLTGVDAEGETALVYFDGAFSHSIRKGPLLSPGPVRPRTSSPRRRSSRGRRLRWSSPSESGCSRCSRRASGRPHTHGSTWPRRTAARSCSRSS